MRVLHIGLSWFPGGVENFVKNYHDALADEDIVFDFVDIYGSGIAFQKEFESAGSRIYTIPNYKKRPLSGRKKLAEIIKGYRCVHIHLLSAAGMLPVKAAQDAGVVPIVHIHNSDTVGLVRRTMHSLSVKELRSVPGVHAACSKEAGEWLWGDTGFTVIPNAIDTEAFRYREDVRKALRESMGVNEKTIVAGFVGRLAEQKNPLFAVRVFAAFHQLCVDSVFWVVGDGDMAEEVRQEIAQNGISGSVTMLGRRDDVDKLMQAMDVLLFPSVFEGFGITVIEAQTAGLPVLAADTLPQEAKVLDSMVTLPLTKSAEYWAEEMCRMAQNPDRATDISEIKAAGYDINSAAKELMKLYNLS